jgi:hypothetical protein
MEEKEKQIQRWNSRVFVLPLRTIHWNKDGDLEGRNKKGQMFSHVMSPTVKNEIKASSKANPSETEKYFWKQMKEG